MSIFWLQVSCTATSLPGFQLKIGFTIDGLVFGD